MKCHKCQYYNEGTTDSEHYNECEKFGFSYFSTFYDVECPYIDDEGNLTELGKIF